MPFASAGVGALCVYTLAGRVGNFELPGPSLVPQT